MIPWLAAQTALGAPVFPWEGETIPAVLEDRFELFDSGVIDSGYWPSANGPIAIRFFFTPEIALLTEFELDNALAWTPLSQQVSGQGDQTLIVDADMGVEIKLDLLGVFTGIVPLAGQTISIEADVHSDGLWLPGSAEEQAVLSVDDPSLVPAIEYGVDVVPTVALVVGVGITPQISTVLAGLEVSSESDGEIVHQYNDGDWVQLPLASDRPGEFGLLTRWSGWLDANFSLLLTPSVHVDTVLGSFSLAEFSLPISLAEISELRTTEPAFVVHALPVLDDLLSNYTYGEISAGETTNWQVPVSNIGAMLLEGTARLEGDTAFTVWPATFAVPPDTDSGFVVSFSPATEGEHTATLILATNDPTRPEVRISLSGTAARAPASSDEGVIQDTTTSDKSTLQTCGCSTESTRTSWGLLVCLFVVCSSTRQSSRKLSLIRTQN